MSNTRFDRIGTCQPRALAPCADVVAVAIAHPSPSQKNGIQTATAARAGGTRGLMRFRQSPSSHARSHSAEPETCSGPTSQPQRKQRCVFTARPQTPGHAARRTHGACPYGHAGECIRGCAERTPHMFPWRGGSTAGRPTPPATSPANTNYPSSSVRP